METDRSLISWNRLIRVDEQNGRISVVIEADRRRVDLLQTFGLEKANGVESPDIKKSSDQQMLESRSPLLDKCDGCIAVQIRNRESSIPGRKITWTQVTLYKELCPWNGNTHRGKVSRSAEAHPLPQEVSGRGASLQFTTDANQVASAS